MSLYSDHVQRCIDTCTDDKVSDACFDGLAIWTLEAQTIVDREHIKQLEAARVADREAFTDLDNRLTVALTEIMNAVARENDANDAIDQLREEVRDARAETSRLIRERDRMRETPVPERRGGLRRFPRAVKGALGLIGVARDIVMAAKARRTG